jgi:hypothetical protein
MVLHMAEQVELCIVVLERGQGLVPELRSAYLSCTLVEESRPDIFLRYLSFWAFVLWHQVEQIGRRQLMIGRYSILNPLLVPRAQRRVHLWQIIPNIKLILKRLQLWESGQFYGYVLVRVPLIVVIIVKRGIEVHRLVDHRLVLDPHSGSQALDVACLLVLRIKGG